MQIINILTENIDENYIIQSREMKKKYANNIINCGGIYLDVNL